MLLLHEGSSAVAGTPAPTPSVSREVTYREFYLDALMGTAAWVEVRLSKGAGYQLWHGPKSEAWQGFGLMLARRQQAEAQAVTAATTGRSERTRAPGAASTEAGAGAAPKEARKLPPSDAGALVSCLWHAVLRPRGSLVQALLPMVQRLERSRGFVVVHARSGWADDLYAVPEVLRVGAAAPSADRLRGAASARPPRRRADRGTASALPQRRRADRGTQPPGEQPSPLPPVWPSSSMPPSPPVPWQPFTELCQQMGSTVELLLRASAVKKWQALENASRPKDAATAAHAPAALDRCAAAHAFLDREGGSYSRPLSHVSIPGMEGGGLATLVACAARLAQGAAQRRMGAARAGGGRSGGGGHGGGGGGGGGGARGGDRGDAVAREGDDDTWQIYVASDSPGLQHLVASLPQLARHALPCLGPCATSTHSRSAHPTSPSTMTMMADLWLLGAADHVLHLSHSTFLDFAQRGFGLGAQPQLMSDAVELPPTHSKRVPICAGLRPALLVADDVTPGAASGACLAARWLFLSPFLQRRAGGEASSVRACG